MRKSFVILVAAVITSAFSSSNALAQCAFNEPAKAGSLKVSLVRAYEECTDSHPDYNGNGGCTSPAPLSLYEFGPSGACTARITAKLETDCPFGAPTPCHDQVIKVTCKDVLKPGGSLPVDTEQFRLVASVRATLDDPNSEDVTAVDFETGYLSEQTSNGTVRWNLSDFDFCPLLECYNYPPGCAAQEIRSLSITDPDGNVFAQMGLSTR